MTNANKNSVNESPRYVSDENMGEILLYLKEYLARNVSQKFVSKSNLNGGKITRGSQTTYTSQTIDCGFTPDMFKIYGSDGLVYYLRCNDNEIIKSFQIGYSVIDEGTISLDMGIGTPSTSITLYWEAIG